MAPEPFENMDHHEPETAGVMRHSTANQNAKSMILDKSEQNKSIQEDRKLTDQDELESLEDEDIIPEDERWKGRKCFWQMNEQIRIKWDLFVMILATWN